MGRLGLVLALLLVGHAALAENQTPSARADDPDTELARRYYEDGAKLYAARHYEEALVQFEKARQLLPSPALDFNIARSYDRLGKFDQALIGYRRYVATKPSDGDEVRARIGVLEQRTAKPEDTAATTTPPVLVVTSAPPERPKKRTWVYVVAGVAAAVVVVAVGVGVGLGVKPSDPSAPLGTVVWR